MRLGLRTKLALGFGGLLLILVSLAEASVIWLSRLGDSVEVILQENFRSVLAAQDMKESLERMDSGALFSLTGDHEQGVAVVEAHGPRFQEALAVELSNLTIPGERQHAEAIGAAYAAFHSALVEVLDSGRPEADRRRLYYGTVLPRFEEIKRLADEILRMNQENMNQASVRARHLAAAARKQMYVALLLAAVLAVSFVVYLGRAILLPLRRLTESAQEIAQGRYDLLLSAASRDELGQLAGAFNHMARKLRVLRRSDQVQLARAQRGAQLTIDSLPDPVVLLTPEGEVELANRAASELGFRPAEAAPAQHLDWLRPILREVDRGGVSEARQGYEGALQAFLRNTERFLLPQAVAIRDEDLGLVGITLILVDVTELRKLDAMKTNLVATASHELMTPLTSLSMSLHILLSERLGTLTAEQSELLSTAREDADRLRRILQDLLDVSRLEAGSVPLDLETLAAGELIDEAVDPLRQAFADRGVAVRVAEAPGLPPVHADRTRAALVLTNFLTNALKHTEAGDRVSVEVTSGVGTADRVRFSVTDTGSGIPAEDLDRIFDRFFRGRGEKEPGVGLGLAISREIVVAHGGEIGCQSRLGSGSTFWFDLPAAAAD
jgi:signal transduction histidine kinase